MSTWKHVEWQYSGTLKGHNIDVQEGFHGSRANQQCHPYTVLRNHAFKNLGSSHDKVNYRGTIPRRISFGKGIRRTRTGWIWPFDWHWLVLDVIRCLLKLIWSTNSAILNGLLFMWEHCPEPHVWSKECTAIDNISVDKLKQAFWLFVFAWAACLLPFFIWALLLLWWTL